ncbi:hypothetical protein RCH07_000449 [Arthrobacter sp. CG_A4]|nr:hypothetical protein [Arthrobacter sp. CG_A4]
MSVKAANTFTGQGRSFARAMVEVLGAVVPALAIAAVLLRRGLSGPFRYIAAASHAVPNATQPASLDLCLNGNAT